MERDRDPPQKPTLRVIDLKCWPETFEDIRSGRKSFEIRREDGHAFEVGCHLRLREWDPTTDTPPDRFQFFETPRGYTGRDLTVEVTYLLADSPFLPQGTVAMGIRLVTDKVAFTGEMLSNHGIDTTNENRRLRTVLETLLKREDTTALLVDLAWTDHGFALTFCSPNGNDVEMKLARACVDELNGNMDQTLGLLVQAAREVMDPATTARWKARAKELAQAVERQSQENRP